MALRSGKAGLPASPEMPEKHSPIGTHVHVGPLIRERLCRIDTRFFAV